MAPESFSKLDDAFTFAHLRQVEVVADYCPQYKGWIAPSRTTDKGPSAINLVIIVNEALQNLTIRTIQP